MRVFRGFYVMCAWIIPPVAGLIEPSIAPEFYVDGFGAIELIGSCIRIYCCTQQMPLEAKGEPQLVVAAKIIRPIAHIPIGIGQLAQCLMLTERTPDIHVTGQRPHLVR